MHRGGRRRPRRKPPARRRNNDYSWIRGDRRKEIKRKLSGNKRTAAKVYRWCTLGLLVSMIEFFHIQEGRGHGPPRPLYAPLARSLVLRAGARLPGRPALGRQVMGEGIARLEPRNDGRR